MNKYDKAEAHIKMINSPEYIKQQEEKEKALENAKVVNEKPKSLEEDRLEKDKIEKSKKEQIQRQKESKEALD